MAFTIDQLNEVNKFNDDDILHTRTPSGFDKKIQVKNAGVSLAPHSQHLRTAEYTKKTGDDQWTTILRTRKNVSLYLQITVHHPPTKRSRSVENEWLTLGINGAEVSGDWGVNVLDYDTTEKPTIVRKSLSNNQESEKRGGIYRIRWGNAGDGKGLCLQMQINYAAGVTLHGFSTKIRVSAFGAQRTDIGVSNSFSFFDTQPAKIPLFQDMDGNDILDNTSYAYYYSAFSELIKAASLRSFVPNLTVHYRGIHWEGWPYDDAHIGDINYLYPGIYNNVTIVFDGPPTDGSPSDTFVNGISNYRFPMLSGKYVILGDFKVKVDPSYTSRRIYPKVRVINPNFASGYTSGKSHWLGGGFATINPKMKATDRPWFGANATSAVEFKLGGPISIGGRATARPWAWEPWGFPGGFLRGKLPFANGKFGGGSGKMGGRGFDSSLAVGYARGGAGPCGGGIIDNPHKASSGGSGQIYFRESPWARAGWAIMNIVGKCDAKDCQIDVSAEELERGFEDPQKSLYRGTSKWGGIGAFYDKVHGMTCGGGGGGFFGIRILEGSQESDGSNKNKIHEINARGGSSNATGDVNDRGGGGGGGVVEVYAYNDIKGLSIPTDNGAGGAFVDPDNRRSSGTSTFFNLADAPNNPSFFPPSTPIQSWDYRQWGGQIINMEGGWWY